MWTALVCPTVDEGACGCSEECGTWSAGVARTMWELMTKGKPLTLRDMIGLPMKADVWVDIETEGRFNLSEQAAIRLYWARRNGERIRHWDVKVGEKSYHVAADGILGPDMDDMDEQFRAMDLTEQFSVALWHVV